MKIAFSFGATVALLASMANAHTYLSKLNLDGQQKTEGQCIRPYPQDRNFPILDVHSTDITCGVGGVSTTASETCPVEAGSTITVEWHCITDSPDDVVIDVSHHGPCIVYMAPLESNGAGNVWFKIFEDGHDTESNIWCVDKIRGSGGKLDVTLPADIKSGDYLLRTEIIALHDAGADNAVHPDRGAQFYVNCAQLSVKNGGDAVPEGYAIPGIYKPNDPGILLNIYAPLPNYTIPGPPVYISGSDSGNDSEDTDAASAEEPASQEPPEISNAPNNNSDDVESIYTEASTEPEASSSVDASTDAPEEQPTPDAPAHTTTTTVVAPPGKCH
ncbi:hypothetical protein EV183_002363 [Coemansia sp. RSA 2336]|nr:hypothetical protein EV183_002363 [Coemansia sp. RSA 2336]